MRTGSQPVRAFSPFRPLSFYPLSSPRLLQQLPLGREKRMNCPWNGVFFALSHQLRLGALRACFKTGLARGGTHSVASDFPAGGSPATTERGPPVNSRRGFETRSQFDFRQFRKEQNALFYGVMA